MGQDYMVHGARRAKNLRAVLTVATAAVVAAIVCAAAACGSSSPPVSSASDAYRLAHPTEGLPGTLRTVGMSRDETARRIAGIVGTGVRIVLPTHLPQGYRPAAPYIAVGDGTARPNPEGWGRSYRISYTDGRGLLVLTVGAERAPQGVDWDIGRLRVDGRAARAGRAGKAVVVVTTGCGRLIVVTGRQVEAAAVLAAAESVTGVR